MSCALFLLHWVVKEPCHQWLEEAVVVKDVVGDVVEGEEVQMWLCCLQVLLMRLRLQVTCQLLWLLWLLRVLWLVMPLCLRKEGGWSKQAWDAASAANPKWGACSAGLVMSSTLQSLLQLQLRVREGVP